MFDLLLFTENSRAKPDYQNRGLPDSISLKKSTYFFTAPRQHMSIVFN